MQGGDGMITKAPLEKWAVNRSGIFRRGIWIDKAQREGAVFHRQLWRFQDGQDKE